MCVCVCLQRGNQLVHREEALEGEKSMLLKQIDFRDQFIEVRGMATNAGYWLTFKQHTKCTILLLMGVSYTQIRACGVWVFFLCD